jgi:hypothetical protein
MTVLHAKTMELKQQYTKLTLKKTANKAVTLHGQKYYILRSTVAQQ